MVNQISGLTPNQAATTKRDKATTESTAVIPEQTGTAHRSSSDDVTLSDQAQKLQKAEARLADLPDVDHERVDHIRERLRDGSYEVSPERLAAKIAQFELKI